MYPYLKLASTLLGASFRSRVEFGDASIISARVGITDIDPFMELNNARQISYLEMGRWDYARRVGFMALMKQRKWGFSIGGISIRYRRRLTLFSAFAVTTLPICHDGRWLYLLQEIVRDDQKCSSALIKAGIVSKNGLVPAPEVLDAIGHGDWNPEMPAWVSAWIEAEGQRPWPDNR
jgi:acyl-CoA thioesterase FadM